MFSYLQTCADHRYTTAKIIKHDTKAKKTQPERDYLQLDTVRESPRTKVARK